MKESDLRWIVAEVFEIDPDELTATTALSGIPTHDSVNMLNLMVALEDKAGLILDHTDLDRLRTFGDIEDLAAERGVEPVDRPTSPSAPLDVASICDQQGQYEHAFAALGEAVRQRYDYTTWEQAGRRFQELRRKAAPASVRKLRIALISSSTTDFYVPLLQLACHRHRIDAEVYVAPFGNYRQEILDPHSGLYRFQPEVVIIATHWRDAELDPFSADPQAEQTRVVAQFTTLWNTLLARHSCWIIQHNLDVPVRDPYGRLSGSLPEGRVRVLRELNLQLEQKAPPAVTVLDLDLLSARFGKEAWAGWRYWYAARQHPSFEALPLLASCEVALIRGCVGLAKKALVLDLDNTLWGGVIGEDGLEGIQLGPPSSAGEAYADFQDYVRTLKERGIVLAVCSKNNPDDAREPFQKHDACRLSLDDFAVFVANWQDKASNIRQIAEILNLGLDSLVFVDDNPAERALVRSELPEVAVPELPTDAAEYAQALEKEGYFEATALSEDDLRRAESYRANARCEALKSEASSLEEFLASLKMEVASGPFNSSTIPRVSQLVGKTNQFNLTTRRHSEELIRRMAVSPDCWTQSFRLRDRFGDHGLIGVMVARAAHDASACWEIDTWLMSCRVLGRQVEEYMFDTLVEAARSAEIRTIRGLYIPTAKNGLVADLYPRMGFKTTRQEDDGREWFEFPLADNYAAKNCFVRPIPVAA